MMSYSGVKSKIFECACSSLQHIFRVTLDELSGDVTIDMMLNTYLPFHKRVKLALNYIFRPGQSVYGSYDEVILALDDYEKITAIFAESNEIMRKLHRIDDEPV